MKHFSRLFIAILLMAIIATGLIGEDLPKADVDFFETKIRPVLVNHCLECHSTKSDELGGKLLLDTRDGILKGGESGPAVVAGKPDASLIIQAIRYHDIEMPPEAPLPETVVNDFVRWVKRGAPDPRVEAKDVTKTANDKATTFVLNPNEHWSFFPRQNPTPTDVRNSVWTRDAIDQFVLAKIEAAGLSPTSDASATTLVRRLYYDLIGLPPSKEQTDQFATDYESGNQKAVERLVDQLLAMPQFGERWGRHWLDVARYGESNGDDGLGRNASFPHAWRYRDYVIQSMNDDVPYDRFLMEQIAGDLLDADSAKQRNRQLVATGFLAIGSKPAAAMNKNFAMDVVDDQLNVVSTAVTGLSVACARCHDHKHDPISTREYYAMAGIFTSTETLWGRAADEKLTAPPTELHALVEKLTKDQPKPVVITATPKFPKNYSDVIEKQKPTVLAMLDVTPKAMKVEGNAKFTAENFASVDGANLVGQLPESGDSYSVSFWFKNELGNNKRPITAYLFSRAKVGTQNTGDHIGIGGTHENSRTGKLFVFNGSDTTHSLAGETVIVKGSWNHIVLVRNGDSIRLYLNGVSEAELEGELPATFGNTKTFMLATRADKFAPLKGNVAEFAIFNRALSNEEVQLLHSASGQPQGVLAPKPIGFAMGVRERAKPADCKVHINGETAKLGPVVPRAFLAAYKSSGWDGGKNVTTVKMKGSGRLQLAKWLTQADHPQTARVMANRIWLHLFGQGIVATSDDFGVYGARPTHPKLLDHLAERFVNEGWSIKKLIRAIVLTRTYQLDSRCDAKLADADPECKLLTHHRRRRLDAESLRDSLLMVSGELDLSPGHGSAIENTVQLINWPPGESTNLHRDSNHRSVYLCMLRHAPPPELAAFDLPDPTKIVGTRDETTLPTQSLFLLNSPFVVDQAKHLARELLANNNAKNDASDMQRASEIYAIALQRTPTDLELKRAIDYLRTVRASFPESERQLKSWASLCQAVFVSSEFRYID